MNKTLGMKKNCHKIAIFFCIFTPVVGLFGLFNLNMGHWVVANITLVLFITGLLTLVLTRQRSLSANMLSHISVAHVMLMTYAVLFFPAVGHGAHVWVAASPFFISFFLSSRATLVWSVGFFIASLITGYVLVMEGGQVCWHWDKVFPIALVYILATFLAVIFTRFTEGYIKELVVMKAQAEENSVALEESEARYRTLLDSSMNAVGVHRQGKWLYANPACIKLLGAQNFSDIADKPILEFVHPDHQALVVKRIAEMGKTNRDAPLVEEKFVRLDGTVFCAEVRSAPLMFGGERAFMITAKDISQQKKYEMEQQSLQQQLEHAQRLESLGVLAGGIAHDFNNILAAIMGNAEILGHEIKDLPAAKELMHNIDESCDHAADLCQQMLAYAGKGKYVSEAIDVNMLVQSMSKLIRASVNSNISLKVKLDSNLALIEGDRSQIQQIILNFIVNSADAIGEKSGVIKLTTGTKYVDQAFKNLLYNGSNIAEGEYVVFEVKDSGCGIDKAIQAKIFDPFFTTKTMGSGLGLSAVLGIVRSHQGAVQLKSTLGEGTIFRIFLPISSQLEVTGVVTTGEVNMWSGEGLVLIVDDEVTVREVVGNFVKKLKFDVVSAVDGRQGIDVFQQHHHQLVAVLLDMTMPKLGGLDCMRAMRKINNQVPIIMVSGYSEIELGNLIGREQPDAFVQKPFKFKDIQKVLYKITCKAKKTMSS